MNNNLFLSRYLHPSFIPRIVRKLKLVFCLFPIYQMTFVLINISLFLMSIKNYRQNVKPM